MDTAISANKRNVERFRACKDLYIEQKLEATKPVHSVFPHSGEGQICNPAARESTTAPALTHHRSHLVAT